MGNHQVGILQPETDVQTVESTHAAVEQRRVPTEPCQVHRSLLDRLGIGGGYHLLARTQNQPQQFNRFLVRKSLGVCLHNRRAVFPLHPGYGFYQLRLVHFFHGGVVAAQGEFTGRGAEQHRHIGRRAFGVGIEGFRRDVEAIAYRSESAPHHAAPAFLLIEFRGSTIRQGNVIQPRHLLQLAHLRRLQAGFFQDSLAQLRAITAADGARDVAAQSHCLVQQPLRLGHRYERADLGTAARLSHNGHIAGVAAKLFNVVVHPLQACHQVEDAHIARLGKSLAVHTREIAETDGAQAVVHGHEHDIAIAADVLALIPVLLDGIAVGETTAVQPHQHRTLLAVCQTRGPDIQHQAVFAHVVIIPMVGESAVVVAVFPCRNLGSRIAPKDSRTDAFPRFGLTGRHEAVLARRTGTIRDAAERIYTS